MNIKKVIKKADKTELLKLIPKIVNIVLGISDIGFKLGSNIFLNILISCIN